MHNTYTNKYGMQIAIYNQSCYDYDLLQNESCICIKATIDSKEFVIGHGYETTAIAKYHAKTITDLFLIKTYIYKVTKLEDRSLITEMIYDGERHFYNRLKREKRITESINSKLNPEEIKTVDPSIIDSLK